MVKTVAKVGIGAAIIYGLYWLFNQGQQIASQFGFKVAGYGSPGINGTTLTLPVQVEFNNPTPAQINIDNVDIQMYINKNGWVKVGSISQPLQLPPGIAQQKLNVNLDLSKIFGGSLFDTLSAALATYSAKSLSVRSDVSVTYGGVTLPTQQYSQNIQIG